MIKKGELTDKEAYINAYVNFLNSKNIDKASIDSRIQFAKELTSHLSEIPTREGYGKAIQATLDSLETIDRQQQLNFGREFYPFLMEDLKSIARISGTYGLDLTSTKFKKLPTVLDWDAIDAMASEPLETVEEDLLSDYALSLKKKNKITESLIEDKVKLVKLVLLIVRDIPIKNNVGYRMAIDVILPLFDIGASKQQFLESVREFFYIWIEKVDPDFLK